MLQIQDVGLEIMEKRPKSLYIFAGVEYGIKLKYVEMLKQHYGNMVEAPDLNELVASFAVKRFVSLPPAVYVVRYDTDFLSKLDPKLAEKILSLHVPGTIVLLYQDDKATSKLDKYFPDNVVVISKVDSQFVFKYLRADFPTLPDKYIELASQKSRDYYQAMLMCESWSAVDPQELYAYTDIQLLELAGLSLTSQELQIKQAIAARNFPLIVDAIERFSGDLNQVYYIMLSTILEIDKFLDAKYGQSDILVYVKRWSHQDTYNMFMNIYDELVKSRTISTEIKDRLIYLGSLVAFTFVPEVEMLC